jgi:uncharacterized membrane protein
MDRVRSLAEGAGRGVGPEVAGRPPSQLHRALAVLATISLFIGTRAVWTDALTLTPTVLSIISLGYLAILSLATLAMVVRTRRALARVDLLILGLAMVQVIGALIIQHTPTDEGTLIAQAARSLLGGGEVYGVAWPQLFAQQHLPVTWMMGGGADYTFGYPPLAVLLTAPGLLVFGFPAVASIVTTLVLLIGTVVFWWLLPIDWRSGATAVMLGFPFMPHYARLGFPAIIAMVWLIPVVVRWPGVGAGGRLRRSDVLRAICLGAACATQQLAWFLAPFLLVGLFAVRRGELPTRRALATVGSFAGLVAATFLAINLPFIVRDAPAWAAGVALVVTQHAVPHGQGLIDVSFYLTDGSAALDFYSYATLLLAIGLLVLAATWVRRLGPALTVIPWVVFYLSVRSQDGYFLLMTPLWLAAAATAPPSAFAGAWQPSLPSFARFDSTRIRWRSPVRGAVGRVLVAIALLAPALLCATVAMASDEPLELQVLASSSHGDHDQGLWQLTVAAANESSRTLTPHFTISNGQGVTQFWTATGGPTQLAPGQVATYQLTAADPRGYDPGPRGYLYLRALTDGPMTVSTTRIPIS